MGHMNFCGRTFVVRLVVICLWLTATSHAYVAQQPCCASCTGGRSHFYALDTPNHECAETCLDTSNKLQMAEWWILTGGRGQSAKNNEDVRITRVGDGQAAHPVVLPARRPEIDVVPAVVVHAGLAEHGVVLDLALPERRAVAADHDELALAAPQALEHGLVAERVLATLHHEGQAAVDVVLVLLALLHHGGVLLRGRSPPPRAKRPLLLRYRKRRGVFPLADAMRSVRRRWCSPM